MEWIGSLLRRVPEGLAHAPRLVFYMLLIRRNDHG